MLGRFSRVLFGAESSETRREEAQREEEEEEDEEWILLNYLSDVCSGSASVCPEDEDDLVMVPSPTAPPMVHCPALTAPPMVHCPALTAPSMVRCPSLTSLNSTATEPEDPDSPQNLDPDLEFVEAGSLEESWFVTPPACFTRAQPLPLEPSPLENLLIEHPSMSVYLLPLHGNNKPRPSHANRPRPQIAGSLQRTPATGSKAGGKKKENRRVAENRIRSEGIQRRPSPSCLSAFVSNRVDLLQPRPPLPLSKNALRRLNPQRPPKTTAPLLHQPAQRQFNF